MCIFCCLSVLIRVFCGLSSMKFVLSSYYGYHIALQTKERISANKIQHGKRLGSHFVVPSY